MEVDDYWYLMLQVDGGIIIIPCPDFNAFLANLL